MIGTNRFFDHSTYYYAAIIEIKVYILSYLLHKSMQALIKYVISGTNLGKQGI